MDSQQALPLCILYGMHAAPGTEETRTWKRPLIRSPVQGSLISCPSCPGLPFLLGCWHQDGGTLRRGCPEASQGTPGTCVREATRVRRHQELSQALASPRASFTHMGSSGPYQEVISESDGVAIPRVPSFLSPRCHSHAMPQIP